MSMSESLTKKIKANKAQTLKIDIRSFGFDPAHSSRELKTRGIADTEVIDYKFMFETSYDAMLLTDKNGVIVSCNKRAVSFFGYDDLETLEGLTLHALIAGTTDAFIAEIVKTMQEGRYTRIQAFASKRDETFVAVEIIARGTKEGNSDYLCLLIRDVHDSRKAEQTLLSAFHAMDNTDSGIGITDLEGWIVYANRKMLSMLGEGDESKVIGQNLILWFEEEEVIQPMLNAINSGRKWNSEKKVDHEDGTRYLQISAVPDINEDEHILGMVFSIVDITDRRRAEKAEIKLEREMLKIETL